MQKLILCSSFMLGLVSSDLLQARQASPAFEVASIKPTVSPLGVTGGCRGIDSKLAPTDSVNNVPLGRCVITAARLSHLMSIAFGLGPQRISGFPDWDGPNRFDIQAKAEDPSTATEQQLISMLQRFITEQFKLSFRRETKEMPIFVLVVARNGPKNLHPSEQLGNTMSPSGPSLSFKGSTMERLAEFLSGLPAVDRPVRDMTGIQGRFDFSLNVLGAKPDSTGDLKRAIVSWETIFTDIQDQLGLRLEAAKGPVEDLIIEHAEKPSAPTNDASYTRIGAVVL
jgi:uncharacterized protein (TIGR03435 family)